MSREDWLREAAERYHEETEAYDRSVCTGPIKDGRIMPADGREFSDINRNARDVLKRLLEELQAVRVTHAELWDAIRGNKFLRAKQERCKSNHNESTPTDPTKK